MGMQDQKVQSMLTWPIKWSLYANNVQDIACSNKLQSVLAMLLRKQKPFSDEHFVSAPDLAR